MKYVVKERTLGATVAPNPIRSFASIYNALCASGLQDE
jgi:hypothetical protein